MAYHMFFGFNLKLDAGTEEVGKAFQTFAQHLIETDLLQSASALQKRDKHPVLDTAENINHSHFATMSFRDRVHADAAVEHFYEWTEPTDHLHKSFISMTTDHFFICFEDTH